MPFRLGRVKRILFCSQCCTLTTPTVNPRATRRTMASLVDDGLPLPTQSLTDSVTKSVTKFAEECAGKGLIAIDFDATIIQVHTYGRWTGGAAALAAHVRPVFAALLRAAVPMDNVTVAVVTFSGQIAVIRDVLVRIYCYQTVLL